MTQQLLDPRAFQTFPQDHPLAGAINALDAANAKGDASRAREMLTNALRKLLLRGDGAIVASAYASVPPGRSAMDFAEALDNAINASDDASEHELIARVFLLPVLFITAGKSPATVTGVVPDIAEIQRTLKEAGAFGPIENFGLSNALSSQAAISAIVVQQLFESTRAFGGRSDALDMLGPEDIDVDSANEQVHLRYLTGAAVSATNAPTFLETAGTVGRWGKRVSQALVRQITEPGLQLLALPRAPLPWYRALAEGGFALEELRFNLFLSSALRELRASTGEPEVTVSAPPGDYVRIDLASQFDDMQHYSHQWHLGREHTIERADESIMGLLRDCRVQL